MTDHVEAKSTSALNLFFLLTETGSAFGGLLGSSINMYDFSTMMFVMAIYCMIRRKLNQ